MTSTPTLPPVASLNGTSHERASALREAFSRSAARSSNPAQFALTVSGDPLIDLAHGIETDRPVQVFSVSKMLVAVAAVHAHERGLLDLDAPLASYWPAFDRATTRAITAMHVLDHSSGISAVARPMSMEQLVAGELDEAVAQQEPMWEPGTAHGYAAFTFGALMAGVFRHATSTTVQRYVQQTIVEPAGASFSFGADEQLRARLAPLTFRPPVFTEAQAAEMVAGEELHDGAMLPIRLDSPGFFTNPEVLSCDWPAMSGITTAHDLAAMFTRVLGYDGSTPLLNEASLQRLTTERHFGLDRGLPYLSRYGAGVELSHTLSPLLGEGSFGHQGACGSVLAVDPRTQTVFAYTSTLMDTTIGVADQAFILLGAAASEVAR